MNWDAEHPYLRNMESTTYFSDEALARFVSAQGKTIEKIICHLWQNTLDKNATVELIDNLELHFTDKQKLTISCNEQGDGLDAIAFDYKASAQALQAEFGGQIKLFAVDASSTKMWQDVIGLSLESIRIVKEGDYHKAGSVLLVFGQEMRIVSISPLDGLVIDFYEED